MTGSLRTHGNGAISIWSNRVTLSPLLRSAKRPAWDRVLPNAVVAQTPSSETVNSLSTARTVSLYQVCEAVSASTPTILGHAVGHEREQNSIRQRIQLDEIVVVRCSQTHGDAAVPVRRTSGRFKRMLISTFFAALS
jgi:hypothetical protein